MKWKGLGYNQASWELENASFLRTPGAMKLINNFENRHKNIVRVLHSPEKFEVNLKTSNGIVLIMLLKFVYFQIL